MVRAKLDNDLTLADGEPLSIRDAAMICGVGSTRVVQLERKAIAKIRELFEKLKINCLESLGDVPASDFEPLIVVPEESKTDSFPVSQGWFNVDRVVLMNGGTCCPIEMVRCFQVLKRRNESSVCLPVYAVTKSRLEPSKSVAAGIDYFGVPKLRIWPKKAQGMSVQQLASFKCIALVESEFGCDALGNFDVPVLRALIFRSEGKN